MSPAAFYLFLASVALALEISAVTKTVLVSSALARARAVFIGDKFRVIVAPAAYRRMRLRATYDNTVVPQN